MSRARITLVSSMGTRYSNHCFSRFRGCMQELDQLKRRTADGCFQLFDGIVGNAPENDIAVRAQL